LYSGSQFGYIFKGLGMENVDTFFGHSEHRMAIRYILGPCGKFCGNLIYFSCFGLYVVQRKIWQLWLHCRPSETVNQS
jgi:hypothetical protein